MNKIDFTHAGGFPLTQEQLDYLQKSYIAAIGSLATMIGSGPTIVTGCVTGIDGLDNHTCTPGWIYANGELLYCPGGSNSDGDYGPLVEGWQIVTNTTNLVYYDGSSYPALISKIAVWQAVAAAGGANIIRLGNTSVPLPSDLTPLGAGYGQLCRESGYTTLALANTHGSVTGSIKYLKDNLTNMLHFELSLSAATPSAFLDAPDGDMVTVGALPAGHVPAVQKTFMASVAGDGSPFLPIASGYVSCVRVIITAGGNIVVQFVKPSGGVLTETVTHSQSIFLG